MCFWVGCCVHAGTPDDDLISASDTPLHPLTAILLLHQSDPPAGLKTRSVWGCGELFISSRLSHLHWLVRSYICTGLLQFWTPSESSIKEEDCVLFSVWGGDAGLSGAGASGGFVFLCGAGAGQWSSTQRHADRNTESRLHKQGNSLMHPILCWFHLLD